MRASNCFGFPLCIPPNSSGTTDITFLPPPIGAGKPTPRMRHLSPPSPPLGPLLPSPLTLPYAPQFSAPSATTPPPRSLASTTLAALTPPTCPPPRLSSLPPHSPYSPPYFSGLSVATFLFQQTRVGSREMVFFSS